MLISDILKLDGIIIRKIPATSTSLWLAYEGDQEKFEGRFYYNDKGRLVREVIKNNDLAGYMVTFNLSTDSTVHFRKKCDGLGKSIEEAYNDYCTKNKFLD